MVRTDKNTVNNQIIDNARIKDIKSRLKDNPKPVDTKTSMIPLVVGLVLISILAAYLFIQ